MCKNSGLPAWEKHLRCGWVVHTDRRRLITGCVLTTLLLALVLTHTDEYLFRDVKSGGLLYGLSLAACIILGLLAAVRLDLSEKGEQMRSYILFPLLPIVSMTMAECLNGVFTWDWSPQTLVLNYILYLVFYGVVFVFTGSLRWSMLIMNPLIFLLALTNHYLLAFRGTPFVPADFLSIGTAINVGVTYDFSPDYQIIIAVLLLLFLQIVAYKLPNPRWDVIGKIAGRTFFGTLIVCVVGLFVFTDVYAKAGLTPDFWNQTRGYRNTGVMLNFCLNTKYLTLSVPEDYHSEDVPGIVYESINQGEGNSGNATPNIICIMNESLADLGTLGNLKTNVDYMPFLHSLTENTVKGQLYVPVIGAGTSNTEFEFLTGASTTFLPAGSNAYTLYVKNPVPSLVSLLGQQGYSRTAFHPYYPSGWNRTKVYNHLGFEKFYSLYNVIDRDVLLQYQQSGYDNTLFEQLVEQAYPGQEVLARRYVSDGYNYDKLIDMYEQRDTDKPFFMFNVTMQNHGGYTEQSANFQQEVYVVDEQGQMAVREGANGQTVVAYPKANQYLSLIKKSDDAFRELIQYFEQQEEPTVICLFGDHQPNVEEALIKKLMGVDSLYNLSEQQSLSRYATPFYIWANYDIPEQTIERLSVNYLSSYLLQVANAPMSDFNRYLLRLSEQLPVINGVAYVDHQGIYYADAKSSPYADQIAGYEKVCYNMLFDTEQRQEALYSTQ